jgi:rhamnogalacturonyl hydrolase YesR
MIRLNFMLVALGLLVMNCKTPETKMDFSNEIDFAIAQTNNALEVATNPERIPRTLDANRELTTVGIYNWTSGFFAGNLWYLYKLTNDVKWKNEAEKWTEALAPIQHWSGHHDVGFMIYCSYGNGYRFDNKQEYAEVIINAGEALSKRFKPEVGVIESWDYRKAWDGETEWFYPVIIDNMMNLELLFEASLLSGNQKYHDIAVTHADATMKNHYRDDYSCYHVVDYDETNGAIKDKATCQGFTDESSWARGQAWGLYGYVLCYRYTKDQTYLEFAKNIANYILNHEYLPEDGIPLWDYHVNQEGFTPEWTYDASEYPEIPRDASAAAITASALLELSQQSEDKTYLKAAIDILSSLSSHYLANPAENKYFVLDHSVGSIPHGVEKDVPLVYADYYYLEAISRYYDLLE